MARCTRCYAPESMWRVEPCRYCGFPGADTRSAEQKRMDAEERHDHLHGWDHEFRPADDDSTRCAVCGDG